MDKVSEIEIPYDDLMHQAILVDRNEKQISSSQAHKRIETSPLYSGRPQQASHNLDSLITALRQYDWSTAYEICKQVYVI